MCGPCTCLGADDAADIRPELDQRSISGPGYASRHPARSPPSVRQRVRRPGSRERKRKKKKRLKVSGMTQQKHGGFPVA